MVLRVVGESPRMAALLPIPIAHNHHKRKLSLLIRKVSAVLVSFQPLLHHWLLLHSLVFPGVTRTGMVLFIAKEHTHLHRLQP